MLNCEEHHQHQLRSEMKYLILIQQLRFIIFILFLSNIMLTQNENFSSSNHRLVIYGHNSTKTFQIHFNEIWIRYQIDVVFTQLWTADLAACVQCFD